MQSASRYPSYAAPTATTPEAFQSHSESYSFPPSSSQHQDLNRPLPLAPAYSPNQEAYEGRIPDERYRYEDTRRDSYGGRGGVDKNLAAGGGYADQGIHSELEDERRGSDAYGGGYGSGGAGGRSGNQLDNQGRTTTGTSSPSRLHQFFSTLNTRNQILFLSLITAQAILVLAMVAAIYGTINNAIGTNVSASTTFLANPKLETVATYLGLFILAEVFEILVSLDALSQKNIMQIALLIPFQVALLVYSSVLPSQLHAAIVGSNADILTVQHKVEAFAIVIPSIIGVCTALMGWLTWNLYGEMGWEVFKRIGADIQLKKMYTLYQIFVCLLKFDAFFFIGFCIQFLVLVTGTPTAEFVITIAALPIIMVVLLLGALAARIESRSGIWTFFFVEFLGLAYFLYKLIRIYDPSVGDRYSTVKTTLTIFSIISLLLLLMTFVVSGLCFANFGRGLKENIPPYSFSRKSRGGNSLSRTDNGEKISPTTGGKASSSRRMSLD